MPRQKFTEIAFLFEAMRNLNMVDTIGSGIRKMFKAQQERRFPLPEYDFSNNRVSVTIIGKVLDIDYANALAVCTDLTLVEIMALDKVQKHKQLTSDEERILKRKHLIEGRKPNYYIAKDIAQKTGQKAQYTRNAPYQKEYYFELIFKLLREHNHATRRDIDELLWNKLPDMISDNQRKSKIGNLLSELRAKGKIRNDGTSKNSCWMLVDHTSSE